MKVAVIGAGLAGLAAGDALAAAGVEVEIFEARPHWGGHTHSRIDGGFVFDEGPHVSFTKDDRVRDLFAQGAGQIEEFKARITNAFRGNWITHPAQCHLHGLDPDLVTRCITDFVRAQAAPPTVSNYADWCVAMFGKSFAETFPFAYTRKYWTREAAELTTDWVGARMYPPKLEDVIKGALVPEQAGDFHYLSSFRYPREGGYQSFLNSLHRPELLRLDKQVESVDVERRRLGFADQTSSDFDALISTMPLPDLIRAVPDGQAPEQVREAAEKLLCSSLVLVDVAVNRSDLSAHHWLYVYDEEISFARVHFPHMLSARNAPPGKGAIQVEIYWSRHRPLPSPASELPARVVDELIGLGLLRDKAEVLWTRHREIDYANVVFDHDRAPALSLILPWVKSKGIHLAGRYAEWAYLWTDDAARSGWAAASAVLAGA